MTATRYVLDTNILTSILRKDKTAVQRVRGGLSANDLFFLCPVVFYEIYRGLLHRDARKQMLFFLNYTNTLVWDDFTREDWQLTAQHWADWRRHGHHIGDADLLIGVYAVQRNAILVTDNEKHFAWLDIPVENWCR